VGSGVEIAVDMGREESKVKSGMAKKTIKAISSSIPHEQKNQLQANVLQLSEACPFHLANPEDCPLSQPRRMEPTKRLQWFNALSESDLGYWFNNLAEPTERLHPPLPPTSRCSSSPRRPMFRWQRDQPCQRPSVSATRWACRST
jgi:hypothetical protein